MSDTRSGMLLGLAAAAGAFGAVAMMSAATAPTARADDVVFMPDTSSFFPTAAEGYPPLVDVLQGTENWESTAGLPSGNSIEIAGIDTQTTFGSFTNDDFLVNSYTAIGEVGIADAPTIGTQIDFADFGGGFGNEWIDLPGFSMPDSITDIFITPFGDFTLF